MGTTRLSAFFQTEPEGLPAELHQVVASSDLLPVAVDIATTQSAVKHGMAASTTGIVPDGVIAVRLSPTLTVPVRHGVYYFSPSDQTDALWRHPKLVHGATASD